MGLKSKRQISRKTRAPNDESGQLCQLFLWTMLDKNMICFLLHCNIQCCTNKWILKIRAKDEEKKKSRAIGRVHTKWISRFLVVAELFSLPSLSVSHVACAGIGFCLEVLSLIYVCQYYIRMCAFQEFASGWLFDSKINEKKNTQFFFFGQTQASKEEVILGFKARKNHSFEEHGHVWKEINQVLANSSSDPSNLTLHMSEFMICAAVLAMRIQNAFRYVITEKNNNNNNSTKEKQDL